MMAAGLLAILTGWLLIWSGFTDTNPIDELRGVFAP